METPTTAYGFRVTTTSKVVEKLLGLMPSIALTGLDDLSELIGVSYLEAFDLDRQLNKLWVDYVHQQQEILDGYVGFLGNYPHLYLVSDGGVDVSISPTRFSGIYNLLVNFHRPSQQLWADCVAVLAEARCDEVTVLLSPSGDETVDVDF